jgi:hypothetical protein
MLSEYLDGLFINIREGQAARFHPPTEVNGGVQVAADCQTSVAGRRVSTTLRHSGTEFREYFRLSFVVC